jgi:acetylornithine/succinyldiaminopimelate/putrescine aminotransferase
MTTLRQLFFQHVGQTSQSPLALNIERAEGIFLFDTEGNKYIDMISGISVSNLGHGNHQIKQAIKEQVDKHMHLLVYGEMIQAPQVEFAKLLTDQLPNELDSVFFVNSGAEANEGAIKLAKRYTGRTEIIAFSNAYHGSTQALMALMDNRYYTQAFRPLIPDIKILEYNNLTQVESISCKTACVIVEPIQGEAGVKMPAPDFLQKIRERCDQTDSLLIFDEIQTGFGRTGSLFAFQKFGVKPNILTIAKAMGGGMPIGGFVSSGEIMKTLSFNPVLGHITTFGGHPVSSAAALAHLKILLQSNFIKEVEEKGKYLIDRLKHKLIKSTSGTGLFIAFELENESVLQAFIKSALNRGLIADWFLHCNYKVRIAPPLTISKPELDLAVGIIMECLDEISQG